MDEELGEQDRLGSGPLTSPENKGRKGSRKKKSGPVSPPPSRPVEIGRGVSGEFGNDASLLKSEFELALLEEMEHSKEQDYKNLLLGHVDKPKEKESLPPPPAKKINPMKRFVPAETYILVKQETKVG